MQASRPRPQVKQDKRPIHSGGVIAIGAAAVIAMLLVLSWFRSSREQADTAFAPSISHERGGLRLDDTQRARIEGGGWIASDPPRVGQAPRAGAAARPVAGAAGGGGGSRVDSAGGGRMGSAADVASDTGVGGKELGSGTGGGSQGGSRAGVRGALAAAGAPILAGAQPAIRPGIGTANAGAPSQSAGRGADAPPAPEQLAAAAEPVQPPGGLTIHYPDQNNLPTDQELPLKAQQFFAPDEGAVSFWLQPKWEANDATNAMLLQLVSPDQAGNSFTISKDGQALHFSFVDANGDGGDASAAIDGWQPGEKHLVTATWGQPGPDGQKQVSFYVDGQLAGQQLYNQFHLGSNSVLNIGQSIQNGQTIPGQFNNFNVYKQGLTPEELGQAPAAPAGGMPLK